MSIIDTAQADALVALVALSIEEEDTRIRRARRALVRFQIAGAVLSVIFVAAVIALVVL